MEQITSENKENAIVSKTFSLKLKTLSPVSIYNGENLTLGIDFFVEGDKLYYLTETDWKQLLEQDDSLQNEFMQSLINNKFEGFKGALKEEIDKIKGKLKQLPLEIGGKHEALFTIIKSEGRPYIPGSTLKGAIMNALIYCWLNEQENLSTIIKQNKKNKEWEIQENLFGGEGDLYSAASLLAISDTSVINDEFIGVSLKKRFHMTKKNMASTLQEHILPRTTFDFSISVNAEDFLWNEKRKQSSLGKLLYQQDSLKLLFEKLNKFTADFLQFEENRLKEFKKDKEHNLIAIKKQFKALHPNQAMLRIGNGKSFFNTTVVLAIKEKDEDLLRQILKKNVSSFPITFCAIKNQLPGWIIITDENDKNYQDKIDKVYTEEELKSGNEIEGVVLKVEKGKETIVQVGVVGKGFEEKKVVGRKNYLKIDAQALKEGMKCKIYWKNGNYNFNK